MFPRDQLLCNKGKLGCNELSFVGYFIVIFVYKQINQINVMFGSSQDSIFQINVLSQNSWSLGNILIISVH